MLGNHLGKIEQAIPLAAVAIEREPTFYYLRILKADLELSLGRNEDAEQSLGDLERYSEDDGALLKAIQMKMKFANLHPGRATELKELSDKLAALADQIAASSSTSSIADLNGVAWTLYLCRMRLEMAENVARRAVAIDPSNCSVQHTLASILAAEGKFMN